MKGGGGASNKHTEQTRSVHGLGGASEGRDYTCKRKGFAATRPDQQTKCRWSRFRRGGGVV